MSVDQVDSTYIAGDRVYELTVIKGRLDVQPVPHAERPA